MKSKFEKVLSEFKRGTLHAGKDPKGPKKAKKVKNRKQALAIAFSEQRAAALDKMAKGK